MDFIDNYQSKRVFAKGGKMTNHEQHRRQAELWKIHTGTSSFKFRAKNLPESIKDHLIAHIQKCPENMKFIYCWALNLQMCEIMPREF